MDNSGVHKSTLIKNAISSSQNTLLYSVPFRQKTNAIESWFNQFKYSFKYSSNAYIYADLKKAIVKISKKVLFKLY